MYWVLQENICNEEGMDNLFSILKNNEIPHSVHKVIPFIGELLPDIEVDNPVICMGSYSLWRVAERKGWTPGVFKISGIWDNMIAWQDKMLNYDSILCNFGDEDIRFPGDLFFIRPVADSKDFAGTVMSIKEFKEWQEKVVLLGEDDGSGLRSNTKIIISSPKNISKEIRYWIVDGRIVTSSYYVLGGKKSVKLPPDEESNVLVKWAIEKHQPNRAFVIDTAFSNGEWKIVETNCFNAAGFYNADISRIVAAIENMEI